MSTSPRSIREWRLIDGVAPVLAAWEQFRPFFAEHGYRLFVDGSDGIHVAAPPECGPTRAEDEYGRFLPEWLNPARKHTPFYAQTGVHMAAVAPDNTDVVIRIMAIGDDGQDYLALMRALSAPEARVPENHTLPMIGELKKDDVVFGIFPFMWPNAGENPWFETVRQVLDLLEQVLEGLDFLHRRLIAHRDFDLVEVFSNYGRGYDQAKKQPPCRRRPATFRSCCPDIRYFINDFELSVAFAPDSDPASRVVTGIPTARYGLTPETYFKCLPPEALLDAPYCPFKADIYQFGRCGLHVYSHIRNPAGLLELFGRMASDDPAARPSLSDALATVRNIRRTAPDDVLEDVPPHAVYALRRFAPGEVCDCAYCTFHARTSASDPFYSERPECNPDTSESRSQESNVRP